MKTIAAYATRTGATSRFFINLAGRAETFTIRWGEAFGVADLDTVAVLAQHKQAVYQCVVFDGIAHHQIQRLKLSVVVMAPAGDDVNICVVCGIDKAVCFVNAS